jgi:hypothetical protein
MKNLFFTIFIFFFLKLSFCNAQKIEIEKVFGGYKYTQKGDKMTLQDLARTMESNPEASKLIRQAQTNNTISLITGGIGGFLIGYPIGTAISGKEPNWILAGIGAGIAIISFPLSSSANKKAKQAIELYNSSLKSTSFKETKYDIDVVANANSIGLSIKF